MINKFNEVSKEAASDGILNRVNVDMTVNENNIEVEGETSVESKIERDLNSAENQSETVIASLDGFKLAERNDGYLLVSHAALSDSDLGIVGAQEYNSSKDKAELLKTVLKDSIARTASYNYKLEFTGSFVEPVIEKVARGCDQCEATMINGVFCHETGCPNQRREKLEREQEDMEMESSKIEPKKSWLTADLDVEALWKDNLQNVYEGDFETFRSYSDMYSLAERLGFTSAEEAWQANPFIQGSTNPEDYKVVSEESKPVSINENMPRASMADHLAQSLQLEDQKIASANEKIKTEAVNALVSMLQGMGHGSSKIAEVTESPTGYDVMATIDSNGALRAVSIPVTVKEGKVVLPKKTLVSSLIENGLNIQAKLAESFSQEVLNKIAAIEELENYKEAEANAIISERPSVTKEANESRNTMFEGDTDTLTVQKHLLPNHETMKLHDKVSDGTDSWEIVNMESQQLDKNENSSSLWTLKKVAPPKDDGKEPKAEMKI